MLSIFKSKKEEENIFNPPPEIYYEFFRKLQEQMASYNDGNIEFEKFDDFGPDGKPEIRIWCEGYSDFSYELMCDQLNVIPVVYCPNISCTADKVTRYDEDGNVSRSDAYWPLDMQICVVDNEIRCYLLQEDNNDDEDFIERMTFQLNLDHLGEVSYREWDRNLYVPKNQELFVLDSFENCIGKRNDGSYFAYTPDDIVKKVVTLCHRIILFADKEGYYD